MWERADKLISTTDSHWVTSVFIHFVDMVGVVLVVASQVDYTGMVVTFSPLKPKNGSLIYNGLQKIITLLFRLCLSDFQAFYCLFDILHNFIEFCPLWKGDGQKTNFA